MATGVWLGRVLVSVPRLGDYLALATEGDL
jgi:hypothetical protein